MMGFGELVFKVRLVMAPGLLDRFRSAQFVAVLLCGYAAIIRGFKLFVALPCLHVLQQIVAKADAAGVKIFPT